MEAFQKKLSDIEGKITGFDEKLAGFDEMKDHLNMIVKILSAKGKGVVSNNEEIHSDEEDRDGNLKGEASSAKIPVIPSKDVYDKKNMGSPIHDREEDKLEGAMDDTLLKEKWEYLDERVRAIEGVESYGSTDATQLCLVPDVIIPHKFKMHEFEKYDCTTCPTNHLIMYCNKMANHVRDDKLMIHCFQNSLSGPAARLYMQLKRSKVKRWQDLADAFMKHYKHNQDLAPDREDLRAMEKQEKESFREYAQRWRGKAADVQPALSEKEMVSTFFETLKPLYYNNMVGITTTNFADLLVIGERIEKGIKQGKMENSETSKNASQSKKEEGDVHSNQGTHQKGDVHRNLQIHKSTTVSKINPSLAKITSSGCDYRTKIGFVAFLA
ncbi:unnamed protein product [Linum trigynum]|uniref:Retrotransposon gag domain-containing protein n=1 Tax=Linum trigynum TaxID=586398 RepID=A0AAV2DVY5_9ROSI